MSSLLAVRIAVALGVLSVGACSPTTPTPQNIVTTGPRMLRISSQSPCSQLPIGVLPRVHTRVTVTRNPNEWVGTASIPAAGDVEVRFRQSGSGAVPGSIPVAGSITGTAIHLPELFSGPAWDLTITFDGSATLTGTAFLAGAFGATTDGVSGVGGGSFTMTDASGSTCTGTTFSWLVAPLPS